MTSTKQAKELMRKSMIIPQPAPYITDNAVKRAVRRKITDKERGLLEARSFTAGTERV